MLSVVRSYNLPSNERIVNLNVKNQRCTWGSKLGVTGVCGDTCIWSSLVVGFHVKCDSINSWWNVIIAPVWKHGPRSPTWLRVFWWIKPKCVVKASIEWEVRNYRTTVPIRFIVWRLGEMDQSCWDPKESELYVIRMKSEETLMEVLSSTNVQIVCQSCV